jgi:hypothetical protein
MIPDLLRVHYLLGGDYEPLRRSGEFSVLDGDPVDLRIPIDIAAVDMHEDEIWVARREEAKRFTAERVLHDLG